MCVLSGFPHSVVLKKLGNKCRFEELTINQLYEKYFPHLLSMFTARVVYWPQTLWALTHVTITAGRRCWSFRQFHQHSHRYTTDTHTLKWQSLDSLKALWHTSLSALISCLNPLRCKAARRSLKQQLLWNCAVMTTLQPDTLERVFYLLKSEWGQREGLADCTGARPFTTVIWMTVCVEVW